MTHLKKILVFLCALSGVIELNAQEAPFGPLSALAQVLRPNDAPGIALGLTGAAYRTGLFSIYTNPAGLQCEEFSLSFSHIPGVSRFGSANLNQEAFGLGLPLTRNLMVAAHFFNLNLGKFEVTDIHGNQIDEKWAGVREFQLAVATQFTAKRNVFSFGVSAKYLDLYFPELGDGGFLLDAGVRYKRNHAKMWYALGVAISNLGEELKHDGFVLDKPVRLLRAGIALGTRESNNSDLGFMSTIEYQKSLKQDEFYAGWQHLGLGGELRLLHHLFGRLGYSFDLEEVAAGAKIDGLTYGLGFKTPQKIKLIFPLDLSLDYGRGIGDYRDLDANVIAIVLGFDI